MQRPGAGTIVDDGFVLAPPDALYIPEDLYDAFDPDDPLSLGRTLDYRTYLATLAQGQRVARSLGIANGRALHDSAISYELAATVAGKKSVGILGGHSEPRGSETYEAVAQTAFSLSALGFTVLTGGGPGAMEAAHLGARYAPRGEVALSEALALLAEPATARFPFARSAELVVDGRFDDGALRRLHAWMAPSILLARETQDGAGESIGIPTWLYGHEPSTPFATRHAKYFENSIREDGLMALATYGTIYAPGSAGTLQEVFQDANQNFYTPADEGMSPMVFLDIEGWWSKRLPVTSVLRSLFGADYDSFVSIVETAEDAVAAIAAHAPGVAEWADRAVGRKLRP